MSNLEKINKAFAELNKEHDNVVSTINIVKQKLNNFKEEYNFNLQYYKDYIDYIDLLWKFQNLSNKFLEENNEIINNFTKKKKISDIQEENNNLKEESNKLKNKKSKKNIESISSHIYFEDDTEDKLNNSIYLEKVNMNNDSLLDYLILGMNNNYIMYISELKKNLKNIDPQNQSKMNWRKIETELKKFPTEFLVINKKSKILVLMIPDLLKPNINKNKIIEIVNLKYYDILKEISINSLLKNLV